MLEKCRKPKKLLNSKAQQPNLLNNIFIYCWGELLHCVQFLATTLGISWEIPWLLQLVSVKGTFGADKQKYQRSSLITARLILRFIFLICIFSITIYKFLEDFQAFFRIFFEMCSFMRKALSRVGKKTSQLKASHERG